MKPRCQNDVEAYLGRPVTVAEITQIESNLAYHFKQAQAEAAANGWSRQDAYREAAIRATREYLADVAKKAQRLSLGISAAASIQQKYAELKALGHAPGKALGRVIEQTNDYIKGVQAQAVSKMVSVIEAAEPRFMKMIENPLATRDFVREVFGESSGNPIAKRAAEAWLKGTEELRVRANRAGFNIGKLDYNYIPQPHDVVAMMKAGREVWIGKIMPRLDRKKYLNDDGSLMTDAAMIPLLERAFDTITTNGTNKLDPAAFQGAGGRANRGSSHRAIHFADATAYTEHMSEFGKGTVWDAMKGHIDSTASSIGIVEEWGPNPQAHFEMLHRQAIKDAGGRDKNYGGYVVNVKSQWDGLAGNTSSTINPNMASINQGIRNLQLVKLGSTVLGFTTDLGVTIPTAALFNNMPVMRTIGTIFASLGKESGKFAAEAGLATESMLDGFNAFAYENLSAGWTSKLGSGALKASLLTGWTGIGQRGFSITMMHGLADLSSRKEWHQLAPGDIKRFQRSGVTEADWNIWRAAPRQTWRGRQIIHHSDITAQGAAGTDAIKRAHDHAASRLLGHIASEADGALVIPDNYTSAAMLRGLKKGTVEGEMIRHIALFKGYPMALGHRFIGRMMELDMNASGRAGLIASFAVMTTMMGAVTTQLGAIAAGLDPIDMFGPNAGKFWFKAFSKGGGGGILGDTVAKMIEGDRMGGALEGLAGPVVGSIGDFTNLTFGEAGKASRGEKTAFKAEALRFARSNTPIGAPMNLWYTRAVVDHMFWHEMQEAASPGYLGRQAARAQKLYGQQAWWKAGKPAPDRAPNIAKIAGQ